MSLRQRKTGDTATNPTDDFFDASPQLVGSIYDSQNLDIPPTIATPRPTPTALESENFEDEKYNNTSAKKAKGKSFLDGAKSLWLTREGVEHDRTLMLNVTIRELITYLFFLIITTIVAFSMASSSMYYYKKSIDDLFVSDKLANVKRMEDVWTYLTGDLITGLYWDTNTTDDSNTTKHSMIHYESRLLGAPRIRMLKVHNSSCEVVTAFKREIKACYGEYNEKNEDYKPILDYAQNSSYIFQTAQSTGTSAFGGTVGSYGGGGFIQLLPVDDPNKATSIIEGMKAIRFIDRGTRAIFVDFSLYNANINLFCTMKIIFELPATGGVFASSKMSVQRLIRYVSTYDYFVFVCELLFCAFVLYYFIEEVFEIIRCRLSYFKDFWNCFDICNLATCLVLIWFGVQSFILTNNELQSTVDVGEDGDYVNMEKLAAAHDNFILSMAFLLILSWIKLMKYLSFNKTMTQLSATLARSAKDIGGFSIMFFIFFFGYAQFGYLIFGTQVVDYSNLYKAAFALLRTILGDFDYYALERADGTLGPIFFLTYVFFVFFILLNMFLAIITDSYSEVKSELSRQPAELDMVDIAGGYWAKLMRLLHLKQPANKERKDIDVLRDSLSLQGFDDDEITEAFIKHDITDRKMDFEEMQMVEDDLRMKHGTLTVAEQKQVVCNREYATVNQRVDRLESTILDICGQIDTLVNMINTLQKDIIWTHKQENHIKIEDAARASSPYAGGKVADILPDDPSKDDKTKKKH